MAAGAWCALSLAFGIPKPSPHTELAHIVAIPLGMAARMASLETRAILERDMPGRGQGAVMRPCELLIPTTPTTGASRQCDFIRVLASYTCWARRCRVPLCIYSMAL